MFGEHLRQGVRIKEERLIFLSRSPFCRWASQGLNLGPSDYESAALTN